MANPPTDEQLAAYFDEALPADQMAAVEKQLRKNESLRRRAANLSRRRDSGVHSVGEIWRRNRLSCPTRHQLGGFVLGTLEAELSQYVEFHIRTVGCRLCAANLSDLEQAADSRPATTHRRRKFFQSSASLLPK
ncbi:MAG: hypothetical protein ACE5KM_04165 [Planctomycetaceae bacterium]